MGNTLRFTLVCLPLLLVLGLLAALLLTNMKQAQLLKSFFLLPMAMPAATIVLIWKMTFSESGFLNRLLSAHTDYMGCLLYTSQGALHSRRREGGESEPDSRPKGTGRRGRGMCDV